MARPKIMHTGTFSDSSEETNYNSTDSEEDPYNHMIGRTAIASLEDLAIDKRELIEIHPLNELYGRIIDSIDKYNQRASRHLSNMKIFPETIEGRRDAIYAEVVPASLINEFHSAVNRYGINDIQEYIPEEVVDALLSHI